jgi:hypothetical protein
MNIPQKTPRRNSEILVVGRQYAPPGFKRVYYFIGVGSQWAEVLAVTSVGESEDAVKLFDEEN